MVENKNIQRVVKQNLCLGCGTCVSTCPYDAIKMVETAGGLLVVKVDESKCVSCGFCYRVCPGINIEKELLSSDIDPFKGNIIAAYCGQAVEEKVLNNGQSGGLVTALLCHLLESGRIKGAFVTKMPDDGTLKAQSILTRDKHEICKAQGSQYCPVALNTLLPKNLADCREDLALVGLPCHIHGLRNAEALSENSKESRFLSIGLFCDGFLTYTAIDYLISQTAEKKSNIRSIEYRSKKWRGWPGDVCFQKFIGEPIFLPYYQRTRIKDVFTPLPCRLCFDKMNLLSDLSFGDPYSIKRDKTGHSLVLVRSTKGHEALLSARDAGVLRLESIDLEKVFEGQHIELKRLDWTAYMQAWKQIGGVLPEFNISRRWLADIHDISLSFYAKNLKWGQYLANTPSANEVLKKAKRHIRFQQFRTCLKPNKASSYLLRKFKNLIKKVLKRKAVYIIGGNFVNKGAEAMVLTTSEAIRKHLPNIDIYVRLLDCESSLARDYGLIPFTSNGRKTILSNWKAKIRIAKIYYKCGIVVDVGGYQFGEGFRLKTILNKAQRTKRHRQLGIKTFYLPQAWGPFSSTAMADAVRSIIKHSTLCYVRDRTSLAAVEELVGKEHPRIRFAHDIAWNFRGCDASVGQELIQDTGLSLNNNSITVCLTPNMRIYEKCKGEKQNNEYINLLRKIIEHLCLEHHAQVVLMGHELRLNNMETPDDRTLCSYLTESLDTSLCVVHIDRLLKAAEIKSVIGNCDMLVSSRYHALIAAFSQGIPAVAIGWAHKYEELFRELGLDSYAFETKQGAKEIILKIDEFINQASEIKEKITLKEQDIKSDAQKVLDKLIIEIKNTIH